MKQLRRVLLPVSTILLALSLTACRHALEIDGRGDIIELVSGERGCSVDEYQSGLSNCTDNDVDKDEEVVYRGLPRPGWRFSHWDGICRPDPDSEDCALTYSRNAAEAWDAAAPDQDMPPLIAVFTQEGETLEGNSYISSKLGAEDGSSYAALLDSLFTEAGNYRYTTQQASHPVTYRFDRGEYAYSRTSDGRLLTGSSPDSLTTGGTATAAMDFLTLVDTVGSDISVDFLQPEQTEASVAAMIGTYYCGHISSWAPGYSRFFRAVFYGTGGGDQVEIISDRFGRTETSSMSYSVDSDGTMSLSMASFGYLNTNVRYMTLAAVSPPTAASSWVSRPSRTVAARESASAASANQFLGTVAGSYHGAWVSLDPITRVTDFLVDVSGQTQEVALRSSANDNFFDQNFILALFDGRLETQSTFGAISADGRMLFIVDTNGNKAPRLAVYVRKT